MTTDIGSVVVLAAGQGNRMRSNLPKVLHQVCGRPMVLHVLDAVREVGAKRTVVVLGYGHEQVLPIIPPGCVVVLQKQQLGTGHAVLTAAAHISPGAFLVLPGDTPLVTGEVLRKLVRDHLESGASATVLTMELDDPAGYGRIVRDADGSVVSIVEHRDADPDQLAIREVNSGMYVFTAPPALEVLAQVEAENDQSEIYLTDAVAGLRERGMEVGASKVDDVSSVLGVNSKEELAMAGVIMQARDDGRRGTGVREQ